MCDVNVIYIVVNCEPLFKLILSFKKKKNKEKWRNFAHLSPHIRREKEEGFFMLCLVFHPTTKLISIFFHSHSESFAYSLLEAKHFLCV
jgi:uncharacterized protein YigE (DUF2233 family)